MTRIPGREYLWGRYADAENTLVKQAIAAYVEKVLEEGDFSLLGLGPDMPGDPLKKVQAGQGMQIPVEVFDPDQLYDFADALPVSAGCCPESSSGWSGSRGVSEKSCRIQWFRRRCVPRGCRWRLIGRWPSDCA